MERTRQSHKTFGENFDHMIEYEMVCFISGEWIIIIVIIIISGVFRIFSPPLSVSFC